MLHLLLPAVSCALLAATVSIPPIESITSDACMTCHDGSSAPQVRDESSHRVGIDYALASSSGNHYLKSVNSPSGFGSTIANDMLVAGIVECTTCHVSHAVESNVRFRLRNEGFFSALCLACHAPR